MNTIDSVRKSIEKLGFKPTTTINKGIPQLTKWYKEYNSV